MKILTAELPTKQAAELAAKITGEGKKLCTIWHCLGKTNDAGRAGTIVRTESTDTPRHAVQHVFALNTVDDDHGDVSDDGGKQQPAQIAVERVAQVCHPLDFFRRTLASPQRRTLQRAAAAAVLADHADNGNGKHEQIQNAVSCRRSLAVALRTLGAVGNCPRCAM